MVEVEADFLVELEDDFLLEAAGGVAFSFSTQLLGLPSTKLHSLFYPLTVLAEQSDWLWGSGSVASQGVSLWV